MTKSNIHAERCLQGALMLHTVVRENIPRDEGYFLLHPLYCNFFTNESCRILLERCGYRASIYNYPAKSWVCYKDANPDRLEALVDRANMLLHEEFLHFDRSCLFYRAYKN